MPRSVASHLDPNCLQRPLKFGSSAERVKVERRKYGTPYNIQYVKNLSAGKKLYQNMSYAALDVTPNWTTKIR
ncbi:hypothetical protein DPMN_145105 [Dreissena polymorpha]|uniref:Uncharacterized protein n=2 Tax=Dreissena polymorpha TaxID=45954 RepID=A0A9D4J100_DREPO|nr:hypothetical protein DPMN_145105 [Dreissena polymorpha]